MRRSSIEQLTASPGRGRGCHAWNASSPASWERALSRSTRPMATCCRTRSIELELHSMRLLRLRLVVRRLSASPTPKRFPKTPIPFASPLRRWVQDCAFSTPRKGLKDKGERSGVTESIMVERPLHPCLLPLDLNDNLSILASHQRTQEVNCRSGGRIKLNETCFIGLAVDNEDRDSIILVVDRMKSRRLGELSECLSGYRSRERWNRRQISQGRQHGC